MPRILATMLFLALAGCAGSGMEEAECRTANWRAIGYEDGAQGRGPDSFGERRRACAEHGVTAKFAAYRAGHAQGLEVYCQPHNGYRQGTLGHQYRGLCPAHLEEAFLGAHRDGYGLYQRRSALDAVGKRLRDSRERAKDIEYLVVEKTAHLVSPTLSPAERARTTITLKQLVEEKTELEAAIPQLEREHAEAEREYEAYRSHIATRP